MTKANEDFKLLDFLGVSVPQSPRIRETSSATHEKVVKPRFTPPSSTASTPRVTPRNSGFCTPRSTASSVKQEKAVERTDANRIEVKKPQEDMSDTVSVTASELDSADTFAQTQSAAKPPHAKLPLRSPGAEFMYRTTYTNAHTPAKIRLSSTPVQQKSTEVQPLDLSTTSAQEDDATSTVTTDSTLSEVPRFIMQDIMARSSGRRIRRADIKKTATVHRPPNHKHSLSITEYIAPNPEGGRIVYEVHDVNVPSNFATNTEAVDKKLQAERSGKEQEIAFYRDLEATNQQQAQELKQQYLQRRERYQQEQAAMLQAVDKLKNENRAREKEADAAYKEHVEKLNEETRRRESQIVEQKRIQEEVLKTQLLDQINDLQKRKEQERLEATKDGTPLSLPSYNYDPEKDQVRRQSLVNHWEEQLRRKREEIEQRQKEKTVYQGIYEADAEKAKQEMAKQLLSESEAKQKMKLAYEAAVAEQQSKAEKEKQEREALAAQRIQQLKEMEQEKRRMQGLRRDRQKKTYRDLEGLKSLNNDLKTMSAQLEREYDLQQMKARSEREVRKKLYRCAKTKKLLPAQEFNYFL